MSGDFDVASFCSGQYQKSADTIVAGLRDLADQVEREARPRGSASVDGTPRHAVAAGQAQHALMWGLANLDIQRLTREAALADQAERRTTP